MPRQILSEISGNCAPRTDLSPYQRGQIVALAKVNKSNAEIARSVGCHPSTIVRTVQRAATEPEGQSRPRPHGKPILSERAKRLIHLQLRRDPWLTWQRLQESTDLKISRRTFQRTVASFGIRHWVSKRRPLLKEPHAAERYKFALQNLDRDWSQVVFSDECSAEISKGKKRAWVFGYPDEKWNKDRIEPYPKGKQLSVMVWAGFHASDRSDLVVMARDPRSKRGGYSSSSYIEVLEEQLPNLCLGGKVFVQDNAPIHTARWVMDWLANNGYPLLKLPPYSPDLNPIEHAWFPLKEKVYLEYPQLRNLPQSKESTRDQFAQALEVEWTQLEFSKVEGLISSMKSRCQAVIDAKGWYTKY